MPWSRPGSANRPALRETGAKRTDSHALRTASGLSLCRHYRRLFTGGGELFLTQPAISDQVRKLEEEYDILLFNRQRKQVTLTPAGEKLLAITLRMFDTESQALELLSESRALRAGTLRIVADAAHHVLHIMGEFRQKYPGVKVSIRAGNTETVVESLYSYDADIGVLGTCPPAAISR